MRCRTTLIASLLALALTALVTAAPLAAGDPAVVDTTPPETTLEQPPSGLVAGSPAVFYYSSGDYFAHFECSSHGLHRAMPPNRWPIRTQARTSSSSPGLQAIGTAFSFDGPSICFPATVAAPPFAAFMRRIT
jgi:hypothetical protein